MIRLNSIWPHSALLGLAIGCTSGCETGADPVLATIRDSAGVRIIENPATVPTSTGLHIDMLPLLEIGRVEGSGPDVFGRVRTAIRLRSGEIAIADAIAREVRIFDEHGHHVVSFGREGEGPGEFIQLWTIGELPGDSIAAVDNLGGRVSVFSRAGEFGRSHPLPRLPDGLAPNVVGWLADGTLVISTIARASAEGSRARTIIIYTVGRDGQLGVRVGEFPDRELGRNGLGLGFGSAAVLTVGDSMIRHAHTSRFEVRALRRDGSVQRIVRVERPARRVTEGEIAEARAAVEASVAREGSSGPAVQRILATEFAETHPVHGRLLVDAAGRLWVAPAVSDLLTADDSDPPSEVSDVFDGEGRLRGSASLPRGLRVTQIGEDYLLGVHADTLGVQRVRLYGLFPS